MSCLLALQSLHAKFGQDWPNSSWEKDVDGWRTMDTDGCHLTHRNESSDCLRWSKKQMKSLKINKPYTKQI